MPRAMGWTAQDQGKRGALGKESLRTEEGAARQGEAEGFSRWKQRENTEDEIILLIEGAGLAGILSCG